MSARKFAETFDPPVTERTVRNWQRDGTVPHLKVGGRVWFYPPDATIGSTWAKEVTRVVSQKERRP